MRNNITLNESRRCADGVGDGVEDGDGAGDNKAKLEKRTKQYRFMMWSLSLLLSQIACFGQSFYLPNAIDLIRVRKLH